MKNLFLRLYPVISLSALALLPLACGKDLNPTTPSAPEKAWTPLDTVGLGSYNFQPAMAVNNGIPYVLAKDPLHSGNLTLLGYQGGSWQVVGNPGFAGATYNTLAFCGSTPYVAFMDTNHSFQISVMALNGGTWAYVGTPGFGSDSEVSLAFSGATPYVAFSDSNYSSNLSVMGFTGGAWNYVGTPGFSTLSYGSVGSFSLAISGSTPYVCFVPVPNTSVSVMSYQGGAWSSVGSLAVNPAFTITPFPIVFSGSTPYVAFQDNNYGGRTSVVDDLNGSAWSYVGSPGFSAGSALLICLAASDGKLYAAYSDAGHDNKATVMCFDGNSWSDVGNPGFSLSFVFNLGLCVDNGTPYVAYSDYANSDEPTVMEYH